LIRRGDFLQRERRSGPRPAATAVVFTPISADAHPRDNQLHVDALDEGLRRKKAPWQAGMSQGAGTVSACSLGQPTTPGFARRTRPTDSEDPGTDPCLKMVANTITNNNLHGQLTPCSTQENQTDTRQAIVWVPGGCMETGVQFASFVHFSALLDMTTVLA
jgi:hypothetical protein